MPVKEDSFRFYKKELGIKSNKKLQDLGKETLQKMYEEKQAMPDIIPTNIFGMDDCSTHSSQTDFQKIIDQVKIIHAQNLLKSVKFCERCLNGELTKEEKDISVMNLALKYLKAFIPNSRKSHKKINKTLIDKNVENLSS